MGAVDYRDTPTEVDGKIGQPRVCAPPFSGEIEPRWPTDGSLARLETAGFSLSRNDRKIVLYGQLLTTIANPPDTAACASLVDAELDSVRPEPPAPRGDSRQKLLFREV
jgi:hypothetical protein